MKVSGFTLCHNCIEGGYPITETIFAVWPYVSEIVAIDIQSTDRTKELLQDTGCKVLSGKFYGNDTCPENFKLHSFCEGDVIIFFEADEVWDDRLISEVYWQIEKGKREIAIYRIQVTQNFQRVKQYPIPVLRVFPKGDDTYVIHPTNVPKGIFTLPPETGYLWDVSNCFRDNWVMRKRNQKKFFGSDRPLFVPEHFTDPHEFISDEDINEFLKQDFWNWEESPFALPEILKPLVGKTKYG